jgi:hypothetical protein
MALSFAVQSVPTATDVFLSNNPETPCHPLSAPVEKNVVLVVQWRTVMCPALRLNTTQDRVDVKPRCHGDTSGTPNGLA